MASAEIEAIIAEQAAMRMADKTPTLEMEVDIDLSDLGLSELEQTSESTVVMRPMLESDSRSITAPPPLPRSATKQPDSPFAFEPRTALLVIPENLTPEDQRVYHQVFYQLSMNHGMRVDRETDYFCALQAAGTNDYDVVITGEGFEGLANYLSSQERHKGTYTVATSCPSDKEQLPAADIRKGSTSAVLDYVKNDLFRDYRQSVAVQSARRGFPKEPAYHPELVGANSGEQWIGKFPPTTDEQMKG